MNIHVDTQQCRWAHDFVMEGLNRSPHCYPLVNGDFDPCQSVGFYRSGRHPLDMEAGIVYHNFVPHHRTVEMSAYATTHNWMTRPVLRVAFKIPFVDMKVRAVMAVHSEQNEAARAFWRKVGATEVVLDEAWDEGVGMGITLLTRKTWDASRIGKAAARSGPVPNGQE